MLNLVRVSAYQPRELAPYLQSVALTASDTLGLRYHPGTRRRLGGDERTVLDYVAGLIVRDSQDDIDETGRATYAVVPEEDRTDGLEVVGLATLIRGVKSRQHRLPLPTGITKHLPDAWTGKDVNLARFNVSAWTHPDYDDRLGEEVYADLLSKIPSYSAWTVEPVRSGPVFHNALRQAGMAATGAQIRYDVGEDGHFTPPYSQAYVRPALY